MAKSRTRKKSKKSHQPDQNRSSTVSKKVSRIRKHLRVNLLGWLALVSAVVMPVVIYYLAYAEPDLRLGDLRNKLSPSWIDSKVDEKNNAISYLSIKLPITNYSLKSGYVDRVEFVPESVDVLPEIMIAHIDKQPIRWRTQIDVEVKYIVSMKIQELLERKVIKLKVIPYDNTGRVCLDEAGQPASFSFQMGNSYAFDRQGQVKDPFLDIHISELTLYDEFWSRPEGSDTRFYPWIGIGLDISNRGKTDVTLSEFQLFAWAKPLSQSAASDRWYVTGTRSFESAEAFGSASPLRVAAGNTVHTHVTFVLRIGANGLSSAEKDNFSNLLADASLLTTNFLSQTYVVASEGAGRQNDSLEFFTQGPEFMFSWDCARSKTAITPYPQDQEFTLVNRHIWRDGDDNRTEIAINNVQVLGSIDAKVRVLNHAKCRATMWENAESSHNSGQ